ncbi:unnamed protein product [Rotaria sordida]|uniref:Uncharacterized protein n=1 Tax=Rotaria sordida TaxID=392033 RepID=A0A820B0F8_9BILA|nr:unnamed protein product [Rotaria sordida]CAF4198744.1 unnamed protein product [Rotaria sordida]
MSSSSSDFIKLHLNKSLKSRHNSTFYQDLLKPQITSDHKENQLLANKKTHLKINQFQQSSSVRNNIIPLSNNTSIIDYKLNTIENKTFNQNHNNENVIKPLFNYLHRPLPKHLRSRELNTKEWFYTESNNILFD